MIYSSDEEFNQSLKIFNTIQNKCIHQLNNYDLKDEFYKNSALFTDDEKTFIFVNARSERAAEDMIVDVSHLNIFDMSDGILKHRIRCGQSKFICMKIAYDSLAILSFKDGSFHIYDIEQAYLYAIFPPPMNNITVGDWICINDQRLIALFIINNSDSASQNSYASIWQWTIPPKAVTDPSYNLCDGSLVLEQPVTDNNKPPTHMLYIEEYELLLTLVEDGAILNIWEFDTGMCLTTLKVHLDSVDQMYKGIDPFVLYTCSVQQSVIKQWDLYHIVMRGEMGDVTLPALTDYSGEDISSHTGIMSKPPLSSMSNIARQNSTKVVYHYSINNSISSIRVLLLFLFHMVVECQIPEVCSFCC